MPALKWTENVISIYKLSAAISASFMIVFRALSSAICKRTLQQLKSRRKNDYAAASDKNNPPKMVITVRRPTGAIDFLQLIAALGRLPV